MSSSESKQSAPHESDITSRTLQRQNALEYSGHAIKSALVSSLLIGSVGWSGELVSSVRAQEIHSASFSYSTNTDVRQREISEDISGAQVTIVTSGKPVFVGIIAGTQSHADRPVEPFTIATITAADNYSHFQITLIRDSTLGIAGDHITSLGTGAPPPRSSSMEIPYEIYSIDLPPAGTHVYTVNVRGGGSLEIRGARLVAYEL